MSLAARVLQVLPVYCARSTLMSAFQTLAKILESVTIKEIVFHVLASLVSLDQFALNKLMNAYPILAKKVRPVLI